MREHDLFFRDVKPQLFGEKNGAVCLGEPALVGDEDEGGAGVSDLAEVLEEGGGADQKRRLRVKRCSLASRRDLTFAID